MADDHVTRQEFRDTMDKVETRLTGVETRLTGVENRLDALDTRMTEGFEQLSEQIRHAQTEMLKAFLPWQEQVWIQFREIEVSCNNSTQTL